MSTIKANTLLHSDGSTTTQPSIPALDQRMAKAWVNLNMQSASINGSYNVSSITDKSSGDFSIAFTSAMASDDYSISTSSVAGYISGHELVATGSFSLLNGNSNWGNVDQNTVCATVFGN